MNLAGVQVRRTGGPFVPVYVFGTAAFEASAFVDNFLDDATNSICQTAHSGSMTWLDNVTFANNTGVDIVTWSGGRVFSSAPGLQYFESGFESEGAKAVPVQTGRTPQFLSFSDPWMLAAAEVRLC